ncbi:MAG TPA: hypothetical protein VI386_34430 [Candidatus Sulfotelmatobacter sp.]
MSEEKANTANDGWTIRGGVPVDYPGCWVVTGTDRSTGNSWSVFRKEDGTYWEITGEHFFPPTGETLLVDLGNEIVDPSRLTQLTEFYAEWLKLPRSHSSVA